MLNLHRIDLVLNEILPEHDILDVGCADHFAERSAEELWLHKYFYEKANSVLGMDLAEAEVEKLKNMGL